MGHRKRDLPLGIVTARIHHDALRTVILLLVLMLLLLRGDGGRWIYAMTFQRREDILPDFPRRAVTEVEYIVGVCIGRAREVDFDL